jgi:Zn finger protein HypA/HybF involved in hydrogenase expression
VHEASLIANLLRQIAALMQQQGAGRVVGVTVKLGALCYISPERFRAHFVYGARGTIAEGAHLTLVSEHDPDDPHAQDVVLDCLEVEDWS